MASTQSSDEALEFIPFLSDVVSKKSKINPFLPYKSALFINDLIAGFLAFGLGSWQAQKLGR